MKIIFEDSRKSPISRLLLGSSAGKDMIFCEGYRGMPKAIKSAIKNGEDAIVYIDVSPHNENTSGMFDKINSIDSNGHKVIIVPIICAEYILLRMLVHYGYLDDICKNDSELLELIIGYVVELTNGVIGEGKSLERVCKHIIENHLPWCLQNKQNKPGKFLCKDCDCEVCDLLEKGCTDGFRVKAERLYASLPLFFMPGGMEYTKVLDSCGAKYSITSLEDAITNIDKFYTELYNSMGIEKTFIVEL